MSLETKQELDLLSLVHVARTPVPVVVAAAALNVAAGSVIATATQLVSAGRLAESIDGYIIARGTTVQVNAAISSDLSGRLADAFSQNGGGASTIGRLLIAGGRPGDAWEMLWPAALDGRVKRTDAAQLELLDLALHALERAQLDGGTRAADLRLQLARLSRARGDTGGARGAVSAALPRLSGAHLVDGLSLAAAIADDLQLPQDAEWWVALAAGSAFELGLTQKLGSLLTFHGRELSRLGFASEARAALSKGNALLKVHGSEIQQFYGALNQAWVDLDQGLMRKAEAGFAQLKDLAIKLEGEASQADKDAYWARALFGSGRPDLAVEAIERAVSLARRIQAPAPQFIAAMAQAEGGILYEQWKYAEAGAHKVVELADLSLPIAWRNAGYYLAARALAGTGQVEGARTALDAALAATPKGSNGLRWRTRIEALAVSLAEAWDSRRAEDLTDLLIQSQWLGSAIDFIIVRAWRDRDRELAVDAAILAMEIGNPAQAARAIETGSLWQKPVAAPVVTALAKLRDHLPGGWNFMTSDEAEAALASASTPEPEEAEMLRARIDEVVGESGLSGVMVLSPTQRKAAGLIRRSSLHKARRPPPRTLVLGAGVVAFAVIAMLMVSYFNRDSSTDFTTTTASTTTTTAPVPTVGETLIPVPVGGLAGTVSYRGDAARTGVLPEGGLRTVHGRYWPPQAPGGSFVVAPVAFGSNLFVATNEDFIYAVDQTSGTINGRIAAATVASPMGVGQPDGQTEPVLVYGDSEGVIHAHRALSGGPELWQFDATSAVQAPPLVFRNTVVVASTGGFLYALDLAAGKLVWQYPDAEPADGFEFAPAFFDGVVYVATPAGFVHMVDVADGTAVCEPIDLGAPTSNNPVIAGDTVFVGLEGGGVATFAAGTCGDPSSAYSNSYPISRTARLSPAVTLDVMFYVDDRVLRSVFLDSGLWQNSGGVDPSPWASPYSNDQLITTPPMVANGVIYIGTQGGRVVAVDAETGEGLWEFDVGSPVRGETLVVPGAVFAGNAIGELWAIAGS